MIQTRPSLQGRFSFVYSRDAALQPRPSDDAGAEKYDHALKVGRETGDWTMLVIPGATPTIFSFEIPKAGEPRRALADMVRGLLAERKGALAASRIFRATVCEISNWEGPKLQWVEVDGIRLVDEKIVEALDEASPHIIAEFGDLLYDRLTETISGK